MFKYVCTYKYERKNGKRGERRRGKERERERERGERKRERERERERETREVWFPADSIE